MSLPKNLTEINELDDRISSTSSLQMLHDLYNLKGDFNHPQISYRFGVNFFIKGDKATAKKCFLKGASFGLKYPCDTYDNLFVDSIGQCFSLLATQYPCGNDDCSSIGTNLGYLFLSRCIELFPRLAQDSYQTRAILLKDHKHFTDSVIQYGLIYDNMGLGVIKDPFIISDFYFAAQAPFSQHKKSLITAQNFHLELSDITVGGKDADEYTLLEMAEFGEKRHSMLFKTIENKFVSGKLKMTLDELFDMVSEN